MHEEDIAARKATRSWIKKIEAHYADLWHRTGVRTDKPNHYILHDDVWRENIYPPIRSSVDQLSIRLHSRCNPKSSQVLALNLFHSLCPDVFAAMFAQNRNNLSGAPEFEWRDKGHNVLRQAGMYTHHDMFVDFGEHKYLVEVKYTENSSAPCSTRTKLNNENCMRHFSKIECPLETNYKTRYFHILRANDSPYRIDILDQEYADCPFLHGEQYQIMRYILSCHINTKQGIVWHPVILYSKRNRYIAAEVSRAKECLKDPQQLISLYLEDIIEYIDAYEPERGKWLKNRYPLRKLTLEDVIREVDVNEQVCPMPQQWHKLWTMLPKRGRIEPPKPLILAAWHEAPASLKKDRFIGHITWAAKEGCLENVYDYLTGLKVEEWNCDY
jgi:hypothetical protein